MTGFYRDGYCRTGDDDTGSHTVCAKVTEEFLEFTKSMGNNLDMLKPGDKWCLCAKRWEEAKKAGDMHSYNELMGAKEDVEE